MLKIVFLALLALSATQINSSPMENAIVKVETLPVEVGGVDGVIAMIQALAKAIQKAINAAIALLSNFLEYILGSVDQLVNIAEAQLNSSMEQFSSQVQALKDRASQSGVDISECLAEEDELNQLPSKSLEAVKKCVENGKGLIINIIHLTEGSINDTMDVVDELFERAKKCSTQWFPVSCLSQLVVKIGDYTMSLPPKIAELVRVAIRDVTNTKEDTVQCVDQEVSNATARGAEIVKNMSDCANKKLPPPKF